MFYFQSKKNYFGRNYKFFADLNAYKISVPYI
jgi:hypothetical protein